MERGDGGSVAVGIVDVDVHKSVVVTVGVKDKNPRGGGRAAATHTLFDNIAKVVVLTGNNRKWREVTKRPGASD